MTPEAMVRSWPVLPPKVMSGFMAFQQQGPVTIKGRADVPCLGCCLGPC